MRSRIKKKKRNEGDEEACELVSVRLVKRVREKVKNREGRPRVLRVQEF